MDVHLEGGEGCLGKHIEGTAGEDHMDDMGQAKMCSWMGRLDPVWSLGLPGVGMDYVI